MDERNCILKALWMRWLGELFFQGDFKIWICSRSGSSQMHLA